MRAWTDETNEGHPFACPSTRLDADATLERCVFRVPSEGVHNGYRRRVDGIVVSSALCAGPGKDETGAQIAELLDPAMVTARTATATARTQREARLAAARTVIVNQVARVKALAPASRTDQDKWLLALSFVLLSEE